MKILKPHPQTPNQIMNRSISESRFECRFRARLSWLRLNNCTCQITNKQFLFILFKSLLQLNLSIYTSKRVQYFWTLLFFAIVDLKSIWLFLFIFINYFKYFDSQWQSRINICYLIIFSLLNLNFMLSLLFTPTLSINIYHILSLKLYQQVLKLIFHTHL